MALLPVFVNTILLAHSHAYLFMYGDWMGLKASNTIWPFTESIYKGFCCISRSHLEPFATRGRWMYRLLITARHPYGHPGFPWGLNSGSPHLGPCCQQHNWSCHLLCQHWDTLQYTLRVTPSQICPLCTTSGPNSALGLNEWYHYMLCSLIIEISIL